MIEVDTREIVEMAEKVRRAGLDIKSSLRDALASSTFYAKAEMQKETPVDTGNLKNTTTSEIRPYESVVYPTADYAFIVHEGRGNGKKIRPAPTKSTKKRVATGRGRQPNRWIDRTKVTVDANIGRFFEPIFNKLFK